jgi:hypothetical protein
MSAIHRVGATIAALVTVAAVGGAFVAQGYGDAHRAAVAAAETQQPTLSATYNPTLDPQTVYVMPVPTAPVIHIIKRAPAPPPATNPPVIHIIVPGPAGGDDGGSGGTDN